MIPKLPLKIEPPNAATVQPAVYRKPESNDPGHLLLIIHYLLEAFAKASSNYMYESKIN